MTDFNKNSNLKGKDKVVTPMRKMRNAVAAAAAVMAFAAAPALANEGLLEMQQDPGQWVMNNGNYQGWNYSELDQITVDNVDQLRVDWTFQTGVLDSHEAQPLVIDDTMYIITPKPNTVYALDLVDEGRIKWSYRIEQDVETARARACCGGQTRGFAYADGKLVFNSLDGQVAALDAETGEELWRFTHANLDIAETMSTPVMVVDNIAIVGIMGGEYGVRGSVTGVDIETGDIAWHWYNTGPNDEVGITERFEPFYASDQIPNPALDTWYGDSYLRGGGTVWGWFTYDVDSNLFYYGTGNCGPWNPDYRRDPITAPGLEEYPNKYCASLMARDATSGELVWAYSLVPQDPWDLDQPQANILIDMEIDGEERKALLNVARNGFYYIFDRLTGEILNEPFAFGSANWAEGIDLETGDPIWNMDMMVYTDEMIEGFCPRIAARNMENDTYNPETGLIYFTAQNECFNYGVIEADYEPGVTWTLARFGQTMRGDMGDIASQFQARDAETGELVWSRDNVATMNAKPVFSTATNLLFQGADDGQFKAFNATTGEELWSFRTGSDFRTSAISYLGPDDKQYIAIIASRGPTDQQVDADAPADSASRFVRTGSTLYVFSLPD